MKVTILLLILFLNQMLYGQFNAVKMEKKCTGVFLSLPKQKKPDGDTLLLAAIQNKKEALANLLNDTIKKDPIPKDEPLFYLPLQKISINSTYGYRVHPILKKRKFHQGIDLKADSDMVYSVVPGEVEKSGYDNALGYYVAIRFKEYTFYYGHLSEYYVLAGQTVRTGQKIGKTGNTGLSTGEHLHFAVKKNNRYINPTSLLNL